MQRNVSRLPVRDQAHQAAYPESRVPAPAPWPHPDMDLLPRLPSCDPSSHCVRYPPEARNSRQFRRRGLLVPPHSVQPPPSLGPTTKPWQADQEKLCDSRELHLTQTELECADATRLRRYAASG